MPGAKIIQGLNNTVPVVIRLFLKTIYEALTIAPTQVKQY